MVVDVTRGPFAKNYPVSYLKAVPVGGWTDQYKTTKLVLRKVPPGTFIMGSPLDEVGRFANEKITVETNYGFGGQEREVGEMQHKVALTKAFYVGVFEVTQRQWELVMDNRPSVGSNDTCYATRPVENVGYDDIRGGNAGANWPSDDSVDEMSFIGRLRARTGQTFDLPTESQWEYSCRAGTSTALNSNSNITDKHNDMSMAEVGRYSFNGGKDFDENGNTDGGTAKVGSYLPNAWGLYDMHGNVAEQCLDWFGGYPDSASDPKGDPSGSDRIIRGGCFISHAQECRSASRGKNSWRWFTDGLRLVVPAS